MHVSVRATPPDHLTFLQATPLDPCRKCGHSMQLNYCLFFTNRPSWNRLRREILFRYEREREYHHGHRSGSYKQLHSADPPARYHPPSRRLRAGQYRARNYDSSRFNERIRCPSHCQTQGTPQDGVLSCIAADRAQPDLFCHSPPVYVRDCCAEGVASRAGNVSATRLDPRYGDHKPLFNHLCVDNRSSHICILSILPFTVWRADINIQFNYSVDTNFDEISDILGRSFELHKVYTIV